MVGRHRTAATSGTARLDGGRSRLVALVATLLAVVLVPLGPGDAAASESLTDVLPRPWSVVATSGGSLEVRAVLDGASDGTASVLLDGEEVAAPPLVHGVVAARVPVSPGRHVVAVEATGAQGETAERAWTFTATATRVRRITGDTRTATAIAVAEAGRSERAPAAVLARADAFADGLAGGPLAAAVDGPLLLTGGASLAPEVAEALERLVVSGATVHLLGGTSALSPSVAADVRALGFDVVRHAGGDRYATAAAVGDQLPASPHAYLASGEGFADALAASAPAARDGDPVLLTPGDELAGATADVLRAREVDRVTLVGGTTAITAGVAAAVRRLGIEVTRLEGPDRYATARALAEATAPDATGVVLASGASYPDALAGGPFAASFGVPVLLTAPDVLPRSTAGWLQDRGPATVDLLGGTTAVGGAVERGILPALVDLVDAPRVLTTTPGDGEVLGRLGAVELVTDVEVERLDASVTVDGREVPAAVEGAGTTWTVTPVVPDDQVAAYSGRGPLDVDVVVETERGGITSHLHHRHVIEVRDPVYATVRGIELHEPSASIDLIGFHQSNHDGALDQEVTGNGVRTMVMPSRGRGTATRGSADIVAEPGVPIVAPATGRVVRGGTYTLYCDHQDHFLVIEPDGHPGIEVKLLHFRDLSVGVGDRVEAGVTRVGSGPRQLPFASQVDEYSTDGWPHVHVEVVDTSIPDRPGSGC